jgi:hypothetical protein
VKTILVYEDDSVVEYELHYDQEYMNICLDEYKRTFSLLRKGRCVIDKNVTDFNLKKVAGCMDEFISMKVAANDSDSFYTVSFVGSINPTVYNILNGPNGFSMDNARLHALYAWYHAIKDNPNLEERDLSLASFDYYNLDEKCDLRFNISQLLSDVSLSYVGKKESALDDEIIKARRNTILLEEFGLKKESVKQLKK